MKKFLTVPSICLLISCLLLLISCSPDEGGSKPNLGLTEIGLITEATVNCTTLITSDGGTPIKACGVCWNTVPYPTIANNKTSDTYGTGDYSSTLTNLSPNTTYYVRAYATNKMGTAYSLQATVITKSFTLITNTPTSVMALTAQCGGLVSSNGDSLTVSERGICWSTSQHPTVERETKVVDHSRADTFQCTLTNLLPNTTYYARVYATNTVGTTYGNEVNFTTQQGVVTITTAAATSLKTTSAILGGEITHDGGASVTERGFCWSTSPNSTISLSTKTAVSSGLGSFTSSLTDLNVGMTYFTRAYAINGVGTTYGNEIEFTTRNGIATLTTTTVTSIKAKTATLGGTITEDGGAPVTERGVCWSTSSNPTINLSSKKVIGSGLGSFLCYIAGLQSGTTFYARSYATNSVGTTYGDEKSFTTKDLTGTVTDVDGNVYHYVTIGTDTWMVENLKTTKYRDGTSIPNLTDATEWKNTIFGAYCDYNNTASNSTTYGRLYNWYAVTDNRKIAPAGWHVPTQDEWVELSNHLGGEEQSGGKLKEAGTTHWISPNTDATNEGGFTALPGGSRSGETGSFNSLGYYGLFWIPSIFSSSDALAFGKRLEYTRKSISTTAEKYNSGLSVRCIRD